MKIFLFITIVIFVGFATANAQQTRFGITAGYLNATEKVDIGDGSFSSSESGFYGGLFVEIPATDQLRIQPELLYANVNDVNFLHIPVMAKFYVSDEFNLQAGPQFNLLLEDTGDDFSAIGIALGFGAGYDITEDFFVAARYALQVNNNYTGSGDYKDRFNFLSIGIGYRF